jgi:hypothetical protein
MNCALRAQQQGDSPGHTTARFRRGRHKECNTNRRGVKGKTELLSADGEGCDAPRRYGSRGRVVGIPAAAIAAPGDPAPPVATLRLPKVCLRHTRSQTRSDLPPLLLPVVWEMVQLLQRQPVGLCAAQDRFHKVWGGGDESLPSPDLSGAGSQSQTGDAGILSPALYPAMPKASSVRPCSTRWPTASTRAARASSR